MSRMSQINQIIRNVFFKLQNRYEERNRFDENNSATREKVFDSFIDFLVHSENNHVPTFEPSLSDEQ